MLVHCDPSHISDADNNSSGRSTSSSGCFWGAVRCPDRLFPPPDAGGSSNTEQVDGVRLQVFHQMLRFVSRQLHLGDCAVVATAIGQAIGRHPSTTQLLWKRLPGHLDVCGTVAGQAEFWGPEGNCWTGTEEGQHCREELTQHITGC